MRSTVDASFFSSQPIYYYKLKFKLLIGWDKQQYEEIWSNLVFSSSDHLHIWGWWECVNSQSEDEQQSIISFSTFNPNSCKKNTTFFSSTTFKILSNTTTSHGILSTPSCWNPNSSSASLNRSPNAWWPIYSIRMMNLFNSFPTHTARNPFGTTLVESIELVSIKERVFLMNLMLLLPLLEEDEVELWLPLRWNDQRWKPIATRWGGPGGGQ